MAKIKHFEEIEGWQMARQLTAAIYRETNDGPFGKDYGLKDQIRRASISIMSNIAEGFGRGGNQELIQFLAIARGSSAEVQSQLYVALDAGYINEVRFGELCEMTTDCGKRIGGFIRYLKQSDMRGSKYK